MLSHTVRHARQRRGLSCTVVDAAAGLLPDTCWSIEHAELIPPPDVLRHLASALVSADQAPLLYVAMLLDAGVVTADVLAAHARRLTA